MLKHLKDMKYKMRYKRTGNSTISHLLSPGGPGDVTCPPPVIPEVTVQDFLQENLIFSLNLGQSLLLRPSVQSGDTPPPGSWSPGGPPHLRPAPSPALRQTGLVTLGLGESPVQHGVVVRHLTALHSQKLKKPSNKFLGGLPLQGGEEGEL